MIRVKKDTLVAGNKKVLHMQELVGLSSDVTNLPTTDMVTGSSFFAVDTGDTYYYDEVGDSWAVPTPGE